MSGFVAIPAVTVICYLAAELYKSFAPQEAHRRIPALCGLAGLLLGVACHLWLPGFIPAENPVIAAAIGAVSGWAATGLNQTVQKEREAWRQD